MENKDVKEMAEVLTKSLDDPQKNAINTEKLVQQVCNMSGQNNHDQVIAGIIADKDFDWEKKVDLIQREMQNMIRGKKTIPAESGICS